MSNSKNLKYRFPFWIAVFFCLLSLVPFGILINVIIIAKVAGILATILLIIAIRFWFSVAKNRNNKIDRIVLNTNDVYTLIQLFPILKHWKNSDMQILKDRIGIILANYSLVVITNNQPILMTEKEALRFAVFLVFLSLEDLEAIKKVNSFVLTTNMHAEINETTCYIPELIVEKCLEIGLPTARSFHQLKELWLEHTVIMDLKHSIKAYNKV
jgi:hypothetical protein